MAITWKDETSYSQGERGRSAAKTWEAHAGRLRITVTRHMSYGPDTWLLCCRELGIDLEALDSKDIDAARSEAIRKIHDTLAADMVALGGRFER